MVPPEIRMLAAALIPFMLVLLSDAVEEEGAPPLPPLKPPQKSEDS